MDKQYEIEEKKTFGDIKKYESSENEQKSGIRKDDHTYMTVLSIFRKALSSSDFSLNYRKGDKHPNS